MIFDRVVPLPIEDCVARLHALHHDHRGRERTEVRIDQQSSTIVDFRLVRRPDTPIENYLRFAVCEGRLFAQGRDSTRVFAQVRVHFANTIAWYILYALVAALVAALNGVWLIALITFAIVAGVDALVRHQAEKHLQTTIQTIFGARPTDGV